MTTGDTQPMRDPPHLHLAAAAFAYPILDGSMTYGEAVAALMRACLRENILLDFDPGYLLGLRERLEATLNRALADVSQETAADIRAIIAICIRRRASKVMLHEAAYAVNEQHGSLLPRKCVDFVVIEEVRKAIGMPTFSGVP